MEKGDFAVLIALNRQNSGFLRLSATDVAPWKRPAIGVRMTL